MAPLSPGNAPANEFEYAARTNARRTTNPAPKVTFFVSTIPGSDYAVEVALGLQE
jgi:hypothetical protein